MANSGTAIAPTSGLNRGERQGQQYVTKVAENRARFRRNEADITEAL